LAGAVVAIDAYALARKTPTLTASFRGARRKWLVIAAWCLLSSHLIAGKP
jgi:hypothetical protein